MTTLAYATNYVGSSNVPAIRLANRLIGLAYPNLAAVYFTCGGVESNESAFKTARFYWKAKGKPDKVKIISREYAYHGVSLAALSATAVPGYAKMFEPRVPNFIHTATPYGYRLQGVRPGETVGQAAARMLEETILREGPETVAAVIAEPVQGAGGIMVSKAILDTMLSVPYGDRWMHAYTYSGHATCCAVGLRNLEILEKEGLVENAAKMGARLLAGMQTLMEFKAVGEVRGLGLMVAVELVADRTTKAAFDPAQKVVGRVKAALEERGLFTRVVRDIILLAPPLVISAAQVDRIIAIVRDGIAAVVPGRV